MALTANCLRLTQAPTPLPRSRIGGALRANDVECDPAELWARARKTFPELGQDYMPSVEPIARIQEIARAVRSRWGSGG